ncbi:28721_t:CDS:1, partial [Racocetra persica]
RRRSHERLEALGAINKNISHNITLDSFKSNVTGNGIINDSNKQTICEEDYDSDDKNSEDDIEDY